MNFFFCLMLMMSSCSLGAFDEILNVPQTPNTRLAFGSCFSFFHNDNDNDYQGKIFQSIEQLEPAAWLWIGDLSYIGGNHTNGYDRMAEYPPYKSLISKTPAHGVWDDHDYGKNDAGKHLPEKASRLESFLDFLQVDPASPRRQSRSGAYHSLRVGRFSIIFLDTRYNRDNHFVPSVGGFKFPFAAVFAALSRFCVAGLKLGQDFAGEVLGAEQWDWFAEQIEFANNDESIEHTIIVSSIQILTQNPFVESWGHFPREKEKLLRYLQASKTKHLLLLSGDVHHAEFSTTINSNNLLEITSSGMTHTCTEPFYGFVCEGMLKSFAANRFEPQSYSTKKNFGLIEETADNNLAVSIRDIHGKRLLSSSIVGSGRDILGAQEPDVFFSGFLFQFLLPLFLCTLLLLPLLLSKKRSKPGPKTLPREGRKSLRLQGLDPEGESEEECAARALEMRLRVTNDLTKAGIDLTEMETQLKSALPHCMMRIRTMSEKALNTRINRIEKAAGKFCIVKMAEENM